MDILALNGSPRGKAGITGRLLDWFAEGVESAGASMETIDLSHEKIHHCAGEYYCWVKKPGHCIWDGKRGDTMAALRYRIAEAGNLVLAVPIYLDGMTGLLKNVLDRMIPALSPIMELDEGGEVRHRPRYLKPDKKIVLISTCGFPEMTTFGPLLAHVDRVARNLHSRVVGRILRPHGMILPYPGAIGDKYDRVVGAVRRAGLEFATEGFVRSETENQAALPFLPTEDFLKASNRWWENAIKNKGLDKT